MNVAPQRGMQPLDMLRRKTAILCVLETRGMVVHFVKSMRCGSGTNPPAVHQVCKNLSMCVLPSVHVHITQSAVYTLTPVEGSLDNHAPVYDCVY